MGFYDDMQRSLQEAIEIEKGNIQLTEKKGMPAPTIVLTEKEREFIKKDKTK